MVVVIVAAVIVTIALVVVMVIVAVVAVTVVIEISVLVAAVVVIVLAVVVKVVVVVEVNHHYQHLYAIIFPRTIYSLALKANGLMAHPRGLNFRIADPNEQKSKERVYRNDLFHMNNQCLVDLAP